MKICWDNLETLKYIPERSEWRKNWIYYIYKEFCKNCGNPFLSDKGRDNDFCSKSCANSGKYNSLYQKKNPFYGRRHSKDTKVKISKANKGRLLGERNPNWKGGISYEQYCPAWSDKDYKKSILEQDGYKCQNPICEKKSKNICIHHIDYNKKNCIPNNLITLCKSCNSKANYNREWWQLFYTEIKRRLNCD